MNKLIIFVLSIASLFSLAVSCGEDTVATPESINKWRLIEQLADPGDGSGTFQPVDSERTIEFVDDETVRSNGSFCGMGTSADEEFTATHNAEEKYILVEGCGGASFKVLYEFDEEFLYLRFPCIEPCAQKYERVN